MPSRSFLPVLHDRRNYVGDRKTVESSRVEVLQKEGMERKRGNEREVTKER